LLVLRVGMELRKVHSSGVDAAMQPSRQATLGIVLAGGGSTRLASAAATGGGKASLTFQGKTFLEHVVAAVAAEAGQTIVVAAPGQTLPALDGVRIVHDRTPGAGPLAGIRDGLRAFVGVDHDAAPPPCLAFVTSCDVPFLRREVVRLLIDTATESDALWTVPVVHGHRQVLVSVMRVELLPRIDAWLAAGRRDLRGLFGEMARHDPRSVYEVMEKEWKAVDQGLASFVDIDTPEDLQRLQSP
jgi:molybdopterin-guanine dinucleotide biosynthesis protein A